MRTREYLTPDEADSLMTGVGYVRQLRLNDGAFCTNKNVIPALLRLLVAKTHCRAGPDNLLKNADF